MGKSSKVEKRLTEHSIVFDLFVSLWNAGPYKGMQADRIYNKNKKSCDIIMSFNAN